MRHTLGCFSFRTGQPQSLRGADRARYGFGVPFPNKFSAICGHKEPIRTPAFGLHSLPASHRLCSAVAPLTRFFSPFLNGMAGLTIVNPSTNYDGLRCRGRVNERSEGGVLPRQV
jgi:hypothetical protein